MNLHDIVGDGHEGWHRAERHPLVVHVEACHDDTHAIVGQIVAHVDYAIVEELCLVDAKWKELGLE